MTDSHEDRKGILELLQSSGKQADWRMWSQKFKARAKIKKDFQILTEVDKALSTLPLVTEIMEVVEKKRKVKTTKFETGNRLGYS
jgi:hypothetical protein